MRIGNAAHAQRQLDVYGELVSVLHAARRFGIGGGEEGWALEQVVVEHLQRIWREPDEGIWEVRGPPRQFVHSKLMAWVAFDRAVASATVFGLEGPVERWRAEREAIREEILREGFDSERNTFVQHYGGSTLDASLLAIPMTGFLPLDDPRVVGTVAAIERHLMQDGLLQRYTGHGEVDGLPGGEGHSCRAASGSATSIT